MHRTGQAHSHLPHTLVHLRVIIQLAELVDRELYDPPLALLRRHLLLGKVVGALRADSRLLYLVEDLRTS